MGVNRRNIRSICLGGTAMVGALALLAAPAHAQEQRFELDVPSQRLDTALRAFAQQTQQQLIYAVADTKGFNAPALSGNFTADEAIGTLLAGTGLEVRRNASGVFLIGADADPQSGSAAGGGAEVEALIVTAQKREEDIQDVPIAISAFSQETLERTQIAGGPDLMTQVPNMTFTKTNFSSYSIQIRGIGTQAISATTDPAVAVAFNNSSMIRNRFFEQEFYDLQRVEVLRGPQGTLYGRNATAGVVNLITAKPANNFEAKLSADVANYSSTRLEGMVNIPIVDDRLALRLAGAWTKREGYVTNQVTGEQIDGRDVWSTRLTLGFDPTDRISAYFTWEHFEEDDDRLRSGKQLCKKAVLPPTIGGFPTGDGTDSQQGSVFSGGAYLSQGCLPASLYSEESFQTPFGLALPYYGPTQALGNPVFVNKEVYVSSAQSRDLRVIESSIEPSYRAKSDLAQLQLNFDLTDSLSLSSETVYATDWLFSTQDFNRFTTASQAFDTGAPGIRPNLLSEEGVYCDPQLGCSDRLLLADLSTARSSQFSQEFRISTDTDGPLNFSAGANFVRYDTEDKYYVFVNSLTLLAAAWGDTSATWVPGVTDNSDCQPHFLPGDPTLISPITPCVYIDPNPIGSLNDLGHNYFLSKNPYRLISYAAFGELYYNLTPDVKVTAGLRYTVDKKHAPRVPSWLLAARSIGYPVSEIVDLEWREPTGRLAIDWKPDLSFTDETLLYASYAHGYKAGGANPPPPVIASYGTFGLGSNPQKVVERVATHPKTFEAEYVDAFELGAKNTLLDGRVTLNANLFYYDYQGYQISQIVDRSAVNSNFDATVWGAELEADWRPLENLRFSLKLGYEDTKLADGSRAIDLIDRTAGDPDYYVVRPFPTVPSNCIVPVAWMVRDGFISMTNNTCTELFYSGSTFGGLDPATVPNNGEGIFKDLSGNELPNAPHLTSTLSVDYTLPLPDDWLMTLHTDLYRQSEAWTRIFNMEGYDKLKAYTNVNLAAIFTNEEAGWKVMAYVKNVFDKDSITGAFLNSDDTGLTTNVFLTEPRLYGIRITKDWSGSSLWGSEDPPRPHDSYPFRFEFGGGASRLTADSTPYRPAFADLYTSPGLPFPMALQDEDLDWGDGRELKVTYDPTGMWSVSAAARTAETNGGGRFSDTEQVAGNWFFSDAQLATLPPFLRSLQRIIEGGINNIVTTAGGREEYSVAEMMVGVDFDLGWVKSKLSGGLRYAEFESTSNVFFDGVPGHEDLPNPIFMNYYPFFFDRYSAEFSSDREFSGAGPALAWDVAKALAGNDDTGRLSLDAGLNGAVLFGKQRTDTVAELTQEVWRVSDNLASPANGGRFVSRTVTTSPPISRSDSATVYSLGATLGVSYEIDRLKLSTGYRWERFYDVLDAGVDERNEVDRTIDGPYFKLAVGFGG